MKLNREIAEDARKAGICDKGYGSLMACAADDIDGLVALYLEQPNWCLARHCPPLSLWRRLKGRTEAAGVHTDEGVELADEGTVVLHGHSTGRALYSGYMVGRLYLADNTELTIEAGERAAVTADLYDCSKATVKAGGQARVTVNLHGASAEAVCRMEDGAVIKVRRVKD